MNKVLLFLFLTGVFISCSKNDDNQNTDLIGKWQLTEVLADPGDGSGTFHRVTSNKAIEFQPNGTVTSNGSICDISTGSNTSSTGTYSLSDSTITSSNCSTTPLKIRFRKNGATLIISYPCDEPCRAKYIKK